MLAFGSRYRRSRTTFEGKNKSASAYASFLRQAKPGEVPLITPFLETMITPLATPMAALKETLKAFFLHSSSIAKPDQLKDLLPKHRYFIAEATLRWQDWPKKIFQLEKALACLKHANETGNDKFHHPFELAIGALLFHAEDALVIDEAKEKITASLENIEGSLVHDLWIKNRVLVGFAPFPNIFVTLYNVDKRLKGL